VQWISHRINTLEKLKEVPLAFGAEIDVRYHKNELILHHDPFNHHEQSVPTLTEFLKAYHLQGPLILNVKTEGIEERCIQLMNQFGVKHWFFLDLSPPYLVKYSLLAQNQRVSGLTPENLAVRFSEYEPLDLALSFESRAGWVWVDCFTHLPLNQSAYEKLMQAGFKICLVSPELQGHSLEKIPDFKKQVAHFQIAAVCTKRADLWQM